MKRFRKDQLTRAFTPHFTEESVQTILGWMAANHGRPPVVVVGAGFTRNAFDTQTGDQVTSTCVPLWSNVIQRLADDLGIKKDKYDFLTLAEYYVSGLGLSAFYNTLLNLLPDDRLRPGPAHEALFSYDSEAIVTTNQLDTMLDRGLGRQIVVADPDLALHDSTTYRRQTIYFHGHRSNVKSWVFTRSHYEDIFNNRPLITTRVRQLLTQHPVLIVGYSLTDPDFHTIYRQISLDMANHHPLGLVIVQYEPYVAERRHWEGLGLRFAVLKDSEKSAEALEAFFKSDPNGPLPTLEHVLSDVRNKTTEFGRRCDYLQELWEEDDRLSRHVGYIHPYAGHEMFKMWSSCISSELPSTAPPEQLQNQHSTSSPLQTGSSDQLTPPTSKSPYTFKVLPEARFRADWPFAQKLDTVLSNKPDLRLQILHWIEIGLDRDILEHDFSARGDSTYIDLRAWLWRQIGSTVAHREQARAAILNCLRAARRYGLSTLEERLTNDGRGLGMTDDDLSIDSTTPLEAELKSAFEAAMNGEFGMASELYGKAADHARQRHHVFAEWIARHGQLTFLRAKDDVRERAKLLRQTIAQLAGEPAVARWIKKAEERLLVLQQETIRAYQRSQREREFGTSSLVFSNSAHFMYRTFRDLESLHAPPSLQIKYLQPLLDYDAFSENLSDGLKLRLRFNLDSDSHWLRTAILISNLSFAERRTQDLELLRVFNEESTSHTEHLARLHNLPAILQIAQVSDLEPIVKFLQDCRARFRNEIKTYNSRHSPFKSFPDAWAACATLYDPAEIIGILSAYTNQISHPIEREQWNSKMISLPWEFWSACKAVPSTLMLDFALTAPGNAAGGNLNVGDTGRTWALHEVVRCTQLFAMESVSEHDAARLSDWVGIVLEKGNPDGYLWEAYRAAFHLGWIVYPESDSRREGLLTRILDLASQSLSVVPISTHALEMNAALLSEILEYGVPTSRIAIKIQEFWDLLNQNWSRFIRPNNHYGDYAHYVSFLSTALRMGVVAQADLVRQRIIDLINCDPETLPRFSKTMRRDLWGSDWTNLIAAVQRAAGGLGGSDSIIRLKSVIGLWANLLAGDDEHPLDHDMLWLVQTGLLAVNNGNHLVANAAAYAVMEYAEKTHLDGMLPQVVAALRHVARDPRVPVRHAAAYGMARLKLLASSTEIRAIAQELDAEFAGDNYAWIQRQRRLGAAKAENEIRTKSTPTSET